MSEKDWTFTFKGVVIQNGNGETVFNAEEMSWRVKPIEAVHMQGGLVGWLQGLVQMGMTKWGGQAQAQPMTPAGLAHLERATHAQEPLSRS